MEYLAPIWLTREYLEIVLRKYKKDDALKVIQLELTPATAQGENFASIIIRMKAQFQLSTGNKALQQESYIAKTAFVGESYLAGIYKAYEPFKTEMLLYEKILPAFSALLSNSGDNEKLFANTIHVDYENTAIIFEDLSINNFTVGDRVTGFDLTHTKFALKQLAKLHATAAVYNERVPNVLTKLDRGVFNRYTKGFAPYFENMIEECAQYAGECPELGLHYKDTLLSLKPHVVEQATRVFDLKQGHFHTLVHGDFWTNNIMINYDGQTLQNMLLIDFQFSCWTTPAVDLYFFLQSSLQNEVCLRQQDELVQYYHEQLTKLLRHLRYAGHIPTLHEFWVQMEVDRFYEVTTALSEKPLLINDNNEMPDANFECAFLHDEYSKKFRKLLYQNKKLHKYIKMVLPIFNQRGLLNLYN